jgi:RNA polymerase sigma-70 factor (ECF subfamily)
MKQIKQHPFSQMAIEQAAAQNRLAQKALYEALAPKLMHTCLFYLKNKMDAEEVMLAAFLKIFANLPLFEFKSSIETWAKRIAINECLMKIRQSESIKWQETLDIDDYDIADLHSESFIDMATLESFIDELPLGFGLVFKLYVIEGYKHQEIAQMLNVSEGTSKSQLFHAKKILQDKINQYKLSTYAKP